MPGSSSISAAAMPLSAGALAEGGAARVRKVIWEVNPIHASGCGFGKVKVDHLRRTPTSDFDGFDAVHLETWDEYG